jgi:hypothetical protein
MEEKWKSVQSRDSVWKRRGTMYGLRIWCGGELEGLYREGMDANRVEKIRV